MVFANLIGNGRICWASPNLLIHATFLCTLYSTVHNYNLKIFSIAPSLPFTVESLATALNTKQF